MKNKGLNNIRLIYLFAFLSALRFDRAIWMLYLVERGMNMAQAGILEALFHATAVLFEVPTGIIGDLYGRKCSLLIGSFLSLFYAVFMMIGGHFFVFTLAFAISGLAGTFSSGTNQALVYDTLHHSGKQRLYTKVSGNISAISLIAMSAAQWAGGIIAKYNWNLVYICIFAVSGLTLLPLFLIQEPVNNADDQAIFLKKQPVMKLWKNQIVESLEVWRRERSFRSPLLLFIMVSCVMVIVMFYGQEYFARMGFTAGEIGFIFTVESLLGVAAAKCAYWVEKRYPFRKLFGTAYLTVCVLLAFFAILKGWSAVAVFFLLGNLSVILEPIFENFVHEKINSSQRATFFSMISLATSAGTMVLFPSFGFLIDLLGFSWSFGILVVLMAFILVCLNVKEKINRDSTRNNPTEETAV